MGSNRVYCLPDSNCRRVDLGMVRNSVGEAMKAYTIFLAVFLGIIVVAFTTIIVTWAIKCIIEWIDDLRSTLKYWQRQPCIAHGSSFIVGLIITNSISLCKELLAIMASSELAFFISFRKYNNVVRIYFTICYSNAIVHTVVIR